MKEINESGMVFPVNEESTFLIEQSDLFQRMNHIRTVEFITLTPKDDLLFVEAKTSFPNAENKEASILNNEKYEAYFKELTEKFSDSLNVYITAALNRTSDSSIGSTIKAKKEYKSTKIKFILVVKNAKEEWLPLPKAELEERLLKMRVIWDVDIVVLNEDMARKIKMVK